MDLKFEFRNQEQNDYFASSARNNCFSGGINNGKSYVGCQRAVLRLTTFPGYGYAICRHKYSNLRRTTMRTMFKILPQELIYRHDEQIGFTLLKNKSFIYWMHLDDLDEEDARGLEINSVLIDQGEEIDEGIKMVMETRVGRWDQAQVPQHLIDAAGGNWPMNQYGRYLVPNVFDVLCNPTEAGTLHWIYREYHPDSLEKKKGYFFIERESDESLADAVTMAQLKERDPEFVETYYRGKWGASRAQIHQIDKMSIITEEDYGIEEIKKLIRLVQQKGALYRVLDHGETGVTCATWWGAINNIHIGFQEYYYPGGVIPEHRHNIHDMSHPYDESGNGARHFLKYEDYADPQIFKKSQQKEGAYTTVAQSYYEEDDTDAEPIYWQPADNNEMATRDRINILLAKTNRAMHPISKISPAPRIYFIKQSAGFPHGMWHSITQTQAARRTLLGNENGKNIYSDKRDEKIVDHAYDNVRYYVAIYSSSMGDPPRIIPVNSFKHYDKILRAKKTKVGANV